MYDSQYAYIKRNPEKYREYARRSYHRMKEDPERLAARTAKRKLWEAANKEKLRAAQRAVKRDRKRKAVEYLGGKCLDCNQQHHAAVYEFHHRDPATKDSDPSKMLGLSWQNLQDELDKCDLLCANCHRIRHHNWEE